MDSMETVKQALMIVGKEDGSDDGVQGVVLIHGEFAEKIFQEMKLPRHYMPDEISLWRGFCLELNFKGFYTQGSVVRSIIHKAARAYLHEGLEK